jgi:hypothetical protein
MTVNVYNNKSFSSDSYYKPNPYDTHQAEILFAPQCCTSNAETIQFFS